jgi:hypothetical protein
MGRGPDFGPEPRQSATSKQTNWWAATLVDAIND